MEKYSYKGWPNCVRLSNPKIELVVTADVGPRVIRYALPGKPNAFREDEETLGRTGDAQFHSYGGHRLWHAPESYPRTYVADNTPVAVAETPEGIRFRPIPEASTGIQKEWLVRLFPGSSHVCILHRLTNVGIWPVRLAPWAISVMTAGGVGILPLPPRGTHKEDLVPTGRLALWAYTDMTDTRWHWGNQYILLRQDSQRPMPQKIGVSAYPGWAAYASAAGLFIKCFSHDTHREYPDLNVSGELFTNDKILEVESLGPLTTLTTGEFVEHREDWFLFEPVPLPQRDEDVERDILPKAREALEEVARYR